MTDDSRTPLELLAPAGNADIGRAAVDHGADAVYIGAPRFSARSAAGVGMDAVAGLIDYAHRYRARVYLALNTILTDAELPEALDLIREAHAAGCDGLIMQDMGLLDFDLPPIPLIASTQMNNVTPEKVAFLEKAGFSRVILARELSLPEIRAIRRQTTVELECFVHGALCVSFSGQCYLSQAAFKRSGNRGVCAQPCRLSYTLRDGRGRDILSRKHLLSLKDLNLIDHLGDLIDAGVTSFKIEGRYKDAAYVKNVTAAYRRALDRQIDARQAVRRQSSGRVSLTFEPDLDRTFNRGYIPYFLRAPEALDHQAAMDSPKSIGAAAGTITRLDKNGFWLSGGTVNNGDGMCFLDRTGVLKGFRVEKVEAGRIIPSTMEGLAKGVRVFRNHDHAFLRELDKDSAVRTIDITMVFHQTRDEIRLSVTDEDGHGAESVLPVCVDEARHPEKMREQIRSQLTRTGATMFSVRELHLAVDWPGFLPMSLLNGLRRETLERLEQVRRDAYVPALRKEPSDPPPVFPASSLDYSANVLNDHARAVYRRFGVRVIEDAFEAGPSVPGRILMTTRYCLRRELGACLKDPHQTVDLVPPLTLVGGKRTLRLTFDCARCRMHVLADE
ncbi:U32 family peptidase [Desulfatiferula olefinivorans]